MKNFPNVPNDRLVHYGYRREPFFSSSMINGGMCNQNLVKKVFGINQPLKILWCGYELFQIQPELDTFTRDVSVKLHKSQKSYISKIIRQCLRDGEELISFSRIINRKIIHREPSRADLAKYLKQYYSRVYNYCVFYVLAWFEKPERNLAEALAEKYARSDSEHKDFLNLITTPSRLTAAELEQNDFLKLCSQTNKLSMEKIRLAAERHAKTFGWLGVRYFIGRPWTGQDVLARLKTADKNRAIKILKEQLAHRQHTAKNLKLWLGRMNKHDRQLVSQIRQVVFLRTQRADYYHQSSAIMQPLAQRVAKNLSIQYQDLLNFSPEELIKALKSKFDTRPHIMPRRQRIITYHSGKNICLEGITALKYIAQRPALQLKVKQTRQLSGQTAYPGKISGRVKIIYGAEDLAKVRRGDILATTMTTPNFISAMERAAAFVTNEGGILCHAAIMAREMNKPCVIGTKIATKIFKDGDLVEVDANKGLVTKL